MATSQELLQQLIPLTQQVNTASFSPDNNPNEWKQYQDLKQQFYTGVGDKTKADFILDANTGYGENRLLSNYKDFYGQYGGHEYISSKYGGFQGLANYLLNGSQFQAQTGTGGGQYDPNASILTPTDPITQAKGADAGYGNQLFSDYRPPDTTDRPYTDPNQAGIYTPPQPSNGYNQYYKDAQGNVFKLDGTPVDQATFQKLGLNIAHLSTKQALDAQGPGTTEATDMLNQGAVTTGRTQAEQSDFVKNIQSQMSQTDSLVAKIMSMYLPSGQESQTQQQLNSLLEQQDKRDLSYQAGANKIGQETIPQDLILGQQRALLQQQAIEEQATTAKITSLQRQLQLLQGDREAQLKALTFAYDVRRQSAQDAMNFYKATAPEMVAEDENRGILYFRNPITGEVTQTKLPGWTPSAGELKYVDLGNRVAMLDSSGNEVGSLPKGMTPSSIGMGDLSGKEQQMFLQITNKFQADSVMQQAGSGQIIRGIANQVLSNPESAPNQLKSLYILVKNLDPDSAVREGELALANSTQSYIQQFGNSLARINEGRVISPDAAVELANATLDIVTLWEQAAQRRRQQYQSQASTVSPNVGSSFSSYLEGFGLQNTGKLNAESDIKETIQANMSTNREELIQSLTPVFPEFTLDEIARYVYQLIPDTNE